MRTEQQALRVSLVAIFAFSVLGLTFGFVSGSYAIVFDGVFSLVDAFLSVISIVVAGLLARSVQAAGLPSRTRRRFTMGFWHFEPAVLALSSMSMIVVAAYALVQSVMAILAGGRSISFGPAIVYAGIVLVMTVTVGLLEHRANRRIQSALVAMDVKGWIMAGGVTAALLVAFAIGAAIDGTRWESMMPYVDPAVLVLVACVLIPVPLPTLVRAIKELAMITPPELLAEAERVVEEVATRHGLGEQTVSAAQLGRARQVEVVVHVPGEDVPRPLAHWDGIRAEIVDALGEGDLHHWINVTFTRRVADEVGALAEDAPASS